MPVLLPQAADRILRVGGKKHIAGTRLQLDIRSGAEIEVGILGRVPVRLRPKVLPAQAEVDGESGPDFPTVLCIERRFVIAVATGEIGRTDGQANGTIRIHDRAGRTIAAGELTLWVDGCLEIV